MHLRFPKARKRPLRLPLWKKAIFAVIPVSILLLCTEGLLWLVGYESPVADPYESFVLKHPLFFSKDGALTTVWPRRKFFHRQSFARSKPASTRRIFAFGGSTTYGYTLPNPRLDSYVNQLGRLLESDFPGTRFEMINCGGLSYASYRLVDLVEECLEYSPDLIIVMSGHNEFTEARHYADLKLATSTSNRLWYSLRTVRFIQHLSSRLQDARGPFLGDNPWANERYVVREEQEYQLTFDHYAKNLERMVDACKAHNTPIILCTCPSNVLDHRPYVTAPPDVPQKEFRQLLRRAIERLQNGDFEQSLTTAEKALADNPKSAILHYLAGKCYYGMKRMEEAQESLFLAKDIDVYPTRARSSFNDCVRDTARQSESYLFDAEALFVAESPGGVPGKNLFVDDCHPTMEGHRLFAEGLKDVVVKILRPVE